MFQPLIENEEKMELFIATYSVQDTYFIMFAPVENLADVLEAKSLN